MILVQDENSWAAEKALSRQGTLAREAGRDKPTPIEISLDKQRSALNELDSAVAALTQRLQPVRVGGLIDALPREDDALPGGGSPMGDAIRERTDTIRALTHRVLTLIEELEC